MSETEYRVELVRVKISDNGLDESNRECLSSITIGPRDGMYGADYDILKKHDQEEIIYDLLDALRFEAGAVDEETQLTWVKPDGDE
jgi:hypothetical protein